MLAIKQDQTLTQALSLLPLNDLLPELIELSEASEKAGDLCLSLILWCGLPDLPTTYSWFGMLAKKFSLDSVRSAALGVLMSGTTISDFEDEPRYMRSWFTATVRGKHETPVTEEGDGVLSLDRFILQEKQP